MPIMDSSQPKGKTLSNLDVSRAVQSMKEKESEEPSIRTSGGGTSKAKKLLRRNSLTNHSVLTQNLLSKRKKTTSTKTSLQPFPGIPCHFEETEDEKQASASPLSPKKSPRKTPLSPRSESLQDTPKRKKGSLKQLSGFFNKTKKNSSSSTSLKELEEEEEEDEEKNELEKQKQEKAIKLQSFWRMIACSKVRKCYSNKSSMNTIKKIIQDILRNEERYITTLITLKDHYIIPLQSSSKKSNELQEAIAGENISSLFPGIDYTIICHSTFIKKLQQCIVKWPILDFTCMISNHVRLLTEIYETLPKTLGNAEILLKKLQQKQVFVNFCSLALQQHPKSLSRKSLKYLISSPLNYVYQFEEICKSMLLSLSNNSLQLNRLFQIQSIVTQLGSFLQEKMEIHECDRIISMLQNISAKEKDKLSSSITRRFYREKFMKVNSKKSKIYLFSDLIYITYIKSNSTLKFTASCPLHKISVSNSKQIKTKEGIKCEYSILYGDKEFKCSEITNNPIHSFVSILEEEIRISKDLVFSLSIDKSMPDEHTLPEIFRKTIYHIDKIEDKLNLFRKPGNVTIIEQLRVNESKLYIKIISFFFSFWMYDIICFLF